MTDTFTPAERAAIMAAVRSRGNKATELKFVAFLRAERITGWRRHAALPGRPDFAFRAARLAVFIDGCFWHGCPQHCRMPASNADYWRRKVERNMERDVTAVTALRAKGWRTLRIWEHDLKAPARVISRLRRALARNSAIAPRRRSR